MDNTVYEQEANMLGQWKIIAGISLGMVAVHILNILTGGYLSSFGIEPRQIGGAFTIATAPMIHANLAHLGNNLIAFAVLGSLVTLQGLRYFVKASAIIVLLGGALVWLFARGGDHVGASGWIFGLWSLVIALAWYDRSPRNIAVALAVLFFYGGMIWGVLPVAGHVSFESHLFGAIAGIFAASILPRKPPQIIEQPVRSGELKFWPDAQKEAKRR
jgi:membrane associated rhomboid family serine protease